MQQRMLPGNCGSTAAGLSKELTTTHAALQRGGTVRSPDVLDVAVEESNIACGSKWLRSVEQGLRGA